MGKGKRQPRVPGADGDSKSPSAPPMSKRDRRDPLERQQRALYRHRMMRARGT